MNNLQEELKTLKARGRDNPPSIQKMVQITTAALAQASAQKAFETFQDKEFRKLSGLEEIVQVEKDRIFNELVLTNLILLMFIFEAPDLRIENDLKDYFIQVKNNISQAYSKQLAELGIEKKYLTDWEKLINMRYEEYSKKRLELRGVAMDMEAQNNTLTTEKLSDIQLLLPVQTVAIGCHHHICRGKTEGKDELFKCILRSLSKFYVEIRVMVEGGKITFWNKIRAKIYRLLRVI